MVLALMQCPTYHSPEVVKHGKTSDGKPRWLCRNPDGAQPTFLTTDVDTGRLQAVKQQMIDMAMNGSGIRDTARVLQISPTTVLDTLKTRTHNARRQYSGVSTRIC